MRSIDAADWLSLSPAPSFDESEPQRGSIKPGSQGHDDLHWHAGLLPGLAGARLSRQSQAVARFVQEMGGNGRCTVIGMGMRTSPVYASLANGLMVHLLDFDDEIMGRGNHPTSAIFPVVMSLGEMNGYSGKQVVTAFALGCELSSKLGAIGDLDYPEPVESARPGWHTDGVAGAIGATAAAAKLLELDQEQLENAFGIASGEAAGIQANLLTPSRAFQCGRAAMNGVMAALLAQRGFTGARDAIEAPGGLLGCYLSGGEVDEEDFFSRLGSPYDVVHPGVVLKVFPCESAGHTSIEAVLQLIQQYRVEPDQVEAVRVRVTPAMLRLLPFSEPQSGWQARFSLSYVVTVALAAGPAPAGPLHRCGGPGPAAPRDAGQGNGGSHRDSHRVDTSPQHPTGKAVRWERAATAGRVRPGPAGVASER